LPTNASPIAAPTQSGSSGAFGGGGRGGNDDSGGGGGLSTVNIAIIAAVCALAVLVVLVVAAYCWRSGAAKVAVAPPPSSSTAADSAYPSRPPSAQFSSRPSTAPPPGLSAREQSVYIAGQTDGLQQGYERGFHEGSAREHELIERSISASARSLSARSIHSPAVHQHRLPPVAPGSSCALPLREFPSARGMSSASLAGPSEHGGGYAAAEPSMSIRPRTTERVCEGSSARTFPAHAARQSAIRPPPEALELRPPSRPGSWS
jgi:hypothetical protein